MKRVMIRYSDQEFGYAMYENGEFRMGKKVYTAEDLKANGAIVTTGDKEVADEMDRIGAPVQASFKPRVSSASLTTDVYEALQGAVGASGMRLSTVTNELYRFFIRVPKEYAEFLRRCQRAGKYPDEVLADMLTEWLASEEKDA